jgi:exopolyphosphatase/guanosine-5'-triphosphate,3'-diphosphate pyrophosphatase
MRRPQAPLAVIDIGSNSARVAVYQPSASGHLHLVAGSRSALRLVREVDRDHRLSEQAVARTLEALADFQAIALGAGARRISAVATAAMRDAENGPALLSRVQHELGMHIEIIDGEREARYGFLGGIHGLPVESGLLFDMGGGSMQVSRFEDRRLGRALSLPLGALRLSSAFLRKDPPGPAELKQLRRHVEKVLAAAAFRRLAPGEALVGTGGTVRNLAKVDARARAYPIARVHGYVLEGEAVRGLAATLARRPSKKRERVPGLSEERGDSIVGGAFGIAVLMETVGASAILVSGQGVREGLAFSLLGEHVPSAREVRAASIEALIGRFAAWDADSADRRGRLAQALLAALVPDAEPELAEALGHAARVLDIGRSVDFFDRYAHVSEIVLASELHGFSHRQLALVAAVIRSARELEGWRSLAPVLRKADKQPIERAGTILALADDIEERCPPGQPAEVRCRLGAAEARIDVPSLLAWRPRRLGERFEAVFRRKLVVRPGRTGPGPSGARQ